MKRFPMKRKTKYALRSYSFPGERGTINLIGSICGANGEEGT